MTKGPKPTVKGWHSNVYELKRTGQGPLRRLVDVDYRRNQSSVARDENLI